MMEQKNIFRLDYNFKTISMLTLLAILPNLLSTINLPTIYGFKIHTFQLAIFLAAAIYGPFGGLVSGSIGSAYSALTLNNPYIIIGNLILGTVTGFLIKNRLKIIPAVLIAYTIQIPWLYLTDFFLINMPHNIIQKIIIALLISNLFWATITTYIQKPIKSMIN